MAPSSRRSRARSFRPSRLIDAAWFGTRLSSLRAEKLLFWGLTALVILAPIPVGGNRPWAWAILEAAAFLLLAA